MATHDLIKLFDSHNVRVFYDDTSNLWYFCVADIVSILTESKDVPQYIKRMRQRDAELNSVWGTICTLHQFISTDGKLHAANCADLEGILRIIQSIPSKKAEPIKRPLCLSGNLEIQSSSRAAAWSLGHQ